jgi:tetratricopeptide (TPR) repeat protein
MNTLTLSAVIVAMAAAPVLGRAPAQGPVAPIAAPQRAFEAGQYDQALQLIAQARERQEAGLFEAFLAANAHLRRSQADPARGEFMALVDSGDDVWRLLGESSISTLDNNLDRALELANQATGAIGTEPTQDPGLRLRNALAFYQLGLVKSRREDFAGAAEAFDRAIQLAPSFAYAHYYAGLSNSRLNRPDQVGARFEVFLKLAPNAPERGAIMSMMRTLRGA